MKALLIALFALSSLAFADTEEAEVCVDANGAEVECVVEETEQIAMRMPQGTFINRRVLLNFLYPWGIFYERVML